MAEISVPALGSALMSARLTRARCCARASLTIVNAVATRPNPERIRIAESEVKKSITTLHEARGVPIKREAARYPIVINDRCLMRRGEVICEQTSAAKLRDYALAARRGGRARCTRTCDTPRPSTGVTV